MEDQERNEIKNLTAAAQAALKQKGFFVQRLKTVLEEKSRLENSLKWSDRIFGGRFGNKTKLAAIKNSENVAGEISRKIAEINNELMSLEIETENKIIGLLLKNEDFLDVYRFWIKSCEFRTAVSDIFGVINKHSRASFQKLTEMMEALEDGRTAHIQEKIKAMNEWENLTIESVKFFLIDFCEYIEQRKVFLQKIYGHPTIPALESHYKKTGISCYYVFDNLAARFWRKPETKEKKSDWFRKLIEYFRKPGEKEEIREIADIREKIAHIKNLVDEEAEIICLEIDAKINEYKNSL